MLAKELGQTYCKKVRNSIIHERLPIPKKVLI